MESQLTTEIKKALHHYKPKISSQMRTIRYADEVWTPNGIVDVIRFEDYVSSAKEHCENQAGCKVTGMMITAYEVKISKKDFMSKNGHNIDRTGSPIGNENYYCVPKDIVKDIEPFVPEHVGILTYHGHGYIRMHKESLWLEVPDETKITLLYNALKKWVDGKQQEFSL